MIPLTHYMGCRSSAAIQPESEQRMTATTSPVHTSGVITKHVLILCVISDTSTSAALQASSMQTQISWCCQSLLTSRSSPAPPPGRASKMDHCARRSFVPLTSRPQRDPAPYRKPSYAQVYEKSIPSPRLGPSRLHSQLATRVRIPFPRVTIEIPDEWRTSVVTSRTRNPREVSVSGAYCEHKVSRVPRRFAGSDLRLYHERRRHGVYHVKLGNKARCHWNAESLVARSYHGDQTCVGHYKMLRVA